MAAPSPTPFYRLFNSSVDSRPTSLKTATIFGPKLKSGETEQAHLRLLTSFKHLKFKASKEPLGLTQQLDNSKLESLTESENGSDLFEDLKHRFLRFKRRKFKENLDHFQNLAQAQAPKTLGFAPQLSWVFNLEKRLWSEMLQIWCPHLRVDPQKQMLH
ncbi:hypothetical protein I3842_06G158300 [Carya illinoinensis]|uniref:Uncharacterized protein n=1 Tax=Carya illinoinensis TaxID=32201 RepID=A0A922EXE8_CARIL|nr:hypothetical protein I3842_06G158300 [Carya illinoinensis]KAG6709945.1 hypothetical protein I3842_06G158300 [Carya illinoinensis]KAG6709946.1 hypothetical protein I3842_06G158300 [Carya illinoinensis]